MKKRTDGRYQKQIYLGKDENGKRITKTVYAATLKELNERCIELKTEMSRGVDLKTVGDSFSKWVDLFLKKEERSLTHNIYRTKKFRMLWWNDQFKDYKIKDIKNYNITDSLYLLQKSNPRTGEESSGKTILEYKSVLSQFYDFLVENDVLSVNPLEKIKYTPPKRKAERRALSEEEREWITQMPTSRAKTMAMLGLYAGLRKGEITALRWDHILFTDEIIIVDIAYDFKHHKFKSTKTESGNRVIPLLPILKDYLESISRYSDFVCGDITHEYIWDQSHTEIFEYLNEHYGNPLSASYQVGWHKKIFVKVPYWTWHELRHTFTTMLYEVQCPVDVASKILGHSKISTTQNIYTHTLDKHKNAVFEDLKSKFKSDSSQTC